MENVILVTFQDHSRAHQAMSELRRLDDERDITLRSAAIVERAADGSFRTGEEADNVALTGSVAGGLVGALVGALAGPLGLLVGGMAGVAAGSVVDAEEADTADVLVTTVARSVPPGATALVADVEERRVAVLDSAMASVGGTVTRRARPEVEAELASTAEALEAAEREAKRVMRERRKATGTETAGDRLADLKDNLKDVKDKVTGGDER